VQDATVSRCHCVVKMLQDATMSSRCHRVVEMPPCRQDATVLSKCHRFICRVIKVFQCTLSDNRTRLPPTLATQDLHLLPLCVGIIASILNCILEDLAAYARTIFLVMEDFILTAFVRVKTLFGSKTGQEGKEAGRPIIKAFQAQTVVSS